MPRPFMQMVLLFFTTLMLCACTDTPEDAGAAEDDTPPHVAPDPRTLIATYEAEDAVHTGKVGPVTRAGSGSYSGTGYVEGFEDEADSCVFIVEIDEAGFYDLNFVSRGHGSDKDNYVNVDGENIGTVHTLQGNEFNDAFITRVYLNATRHEVSLTPYWGWISLDRLEVYTSPPPDMAMYDVAKTLANPASSDITRRLYSYLCDIYGEYILSGQYCDSGPLGKEFQVIKKATGKTPAVLGLDMMDYSPSRVERGSEGKATQWGMNFWQSGGIVTYCWHWNAPGKYLSGTWFSGFYTEHTNMDLGKIMNGEDPEGYELLMSDIDAIAEQLVVLRDAGVPILWRPLHEASGGWFWWGASGPEAYKALYITMFEKLSEEWGLNNLIWVWNGQHADWYPGDAYVDIVGEDIYAAPHSYASQIDKFLAAVAYSDAYKPVHMTENGVVFDPELARRDGAMWGGWRTWGGEFVAGGTALYALSEQYTEEWMLEKAYNDPFVVTLETLPDFYNYPLE